MVAYRLFASGHELRLQRPVTLNSFLQKFCVFILHQPPPHATIKQRLSTASSEGLSTETRRKKTDESFFARFTARQKAETKLQPHPLFLWNTWTSRMKKENAQKG
jgi:hypothetical protein